MNEFINLVLKNFDSANWTKDNEKAKEELFGGSGRYPAIAGSKEKIQLRAPSMSSPDYVPFAAYIHPNNPSSGMYGGMSFVIFPIENGPCLVAMVIGTQGLSPDEYILSKPGHIRRVKAICAWLNKEYGGGNLVAWAKQDPTRIDIDVPQNIVNEFTEYKAVFERYGKVLYGFFRPNPDNTEFTNKAVRAFLDLYFSERGYAPLGAYKKQATDITKRYMKYVFPGVTLEDIRELLDKRRYVIVEGPPGTGKTYLAGKLLREKYSNNGRTIQFHPNTTYENFIGGLAPSQDTTGIGLRFAPKRGYLMDAMVEARNQAPQPYLLNIDEINRADLAKILGEAIYLLETKDNSSRVINLPYDFKDPIGTKFQLPDNLHILGTMNSSDRSIAILDIAIRRRFAFVKLWPSISVVENISCSQMLTAFQELLEIFIDYASDDALNLVPGHAYFLEAEPELAIKDLKTRLYPLLEEYIAQGYINDFKEQVLAYMQKIMSL